ncbi:MAG: ABC transporter substrate-binding protein [Promethearchaeati archaeon SRVP18_Atabeyarchaeia-1]
MNSTKKLYALLFASLMLVGLSSPYSPLALMTQASASGTTARVDPVLNITLIVPNNNPVRIQYGQMVVTALQNLGINSTLAVIPWSEYFARALGPSASTRGKTFADGGFDFNCVGYEMEPDPTYLYYMYHSSQFASDTGGGSNYYLWNNTVNDNLLNAIQHEMNQTRLLQLVHQWQEFAYDEVPSVALYYSKNVVAFAKNLSSTQFSTNFAPRWPGVEAWTFTSSPLTSVTLGQLYDCGVEGLCPAYASGAQYELAGYAPIFGEMGGSGLLMRGLPPTWDVQPYMAYGNYTHSADFKNWTFWIRPGIKFQNGETLDARDVVYTYRYCLTSSWAYPSSNSIVYNMPQVLGSNRSVYWAGEPGTPGASETTNLYKVHINLLDTYAFFLQKICTFPIMPASVLVNSSTGIPSYSSWHPDPTITANFYNTAFTTGIGSYRYYAKNVSLLTGIGPIGAGPYKFVSYNAGTGIHLTKFMGYFNRAALEGAGEYGIVDYYVRTIPKNSNAIAALQAGTVQVLDSTYFFEKNATQLGLLNPSFCHLASHDGFVVQELGFNMQHPIFGTGLGTPVGMADPSKAAEAAKHMRRGIEYLFLKDSILKNMTNGYGSYGVTTPFTRVTWGFDSSIVLRNDTTLNQRLLAIKEFEAAGYHFYVDFQQSGIQASTPRWCFGQYGFNLRTEGADNVSVKFFNLPPPGTLGPPLGAVPVIYLDIHGAKLYASNETILYVYYNRTRAAQLGINENNLALYIWNSTIPAHWAKLTSATLPLNRTHGLIFAVAPHFSYFAVFGASGTGGGQLTGTGTLVIMLVAGTVLGALVATLLLRKRGRTSTSKRKA